MTATSAATDDGWAASADAWIKEQSDGGDYARRFVLDGPMVDRIRDRGFRTALDVGCGEGRFCRIMCDLGIRAVGVVPTTALLDIARTRDPAGDYRLGRAETLDELGGHFDLLVSYLSLIDIPDLATGLQQMVAALRPGGTLLITNLNSFNTAAMPGGWTVDADGSPRFCIDHYLEERAVWVAWRGIRIQNWHRPLSTYMGLLLALRMGATPFRRTDTNRRRPGHGRPLSPGPLVPHYGVAEARVFGTGAEALKADVVMAEAGQAMPADAGRLADHLLRQFVATDRMGWHETLTRDGVPTMTDSPGSTPYHLFMATIEAERGT